MVTDTISTEIVFTNIDSMYSGFGLDPSVAIGLVLLITGLMAAFWAAWD